MEELVKLAKIFSDLNRLKILALIVRNKEVCVCEVCDTLELSQPLVSRHLKHMKEANIFNAKQKGKWVIYSLNENLHPVVQCWIKEINKELSSLPKLIACNTK